MYIPRWGLGTEEKTEEEEYGDCPFSGGSNHREPIITTFLLLSNFLNKTS